MLSDIFPTGFHGAVTAKVGVGATVYIAGAGPVGMAAAASSRLLGAARIIVGDFNSDRLGHARKVGFETVNLARHDRLDEMIADLLGVPEVDCAIDAVGFEARAHGGAEQPAVVLNQLMHVTRAAGEIGIPGLYVTEDPGAREESAKKGSLALRLGEGWSKSHVFHTGQTPVLRYNRALMQSILNGRINIAEIVDARVIPLDEAPKGYQEFDSGAAHKYVLDPHGILAKGA
jgi:glutathione-independent formaldehyde dehydrogenase